MTSQTINLIQIEARLLATVSVLCFFLFFFLFFLTAIRALQGTHSVRVAPRHILWPLFNLSNPISHFKGGGASTEL